MSVQNTMSAPDPSGSNASRRGRCPSVWAPMQTGDGWLLRLGMLRGRLSVQQLAGVADAARRHGNGVIELTRRGNLQLRGASERTLPKLRAELVSLGLAPVSAADEAPASLLVCPLAGLVSEAPALDALAARVAPLLSALQARGELSHKLALVLSQGESACDDVHADVRVELHPTLRVAALAVAGTAADAARLGVCALEDLPRALEALLALPARLGQRASRFRALVERAGLSALSAAIAPWLLDGEHLAALSFERKGGLGARACFGHRRGARSWLGLGVPFGSMTAEAGRALAHAAEESGVRELRSTPHKSVLLLDVGDAESARLGQIAARVGFVSEPPDTRLELVACSGAPACGAALGETRALALELSQLVRPAPTRPARIHVSGCAKGCASDERADVTLVRAERGVQLGFQQSVAEARLAPVLPLAAARELVRRALAARSADSSLPEAARSDARAAAEK